MPHDVMTACSFAGELPLLYQEVLLSCGRMSLQVREARCESRGFFAFALHKSDHASPFRPVAFRISASASEPAGRFELLIRAESLDGPSPRQAAFTAFKAEELMGLVRAGAAQHLEPDAAPVQAWRENPRHEPPQGSAHAHTNPLPPAEPHRLQFDRGDLVRLYAGSPVMEVLASSPYLTLCAYDVDGAYRRSTFETQRLQRVEV